MRQSTEFHNNPGIDVIFAALLFISAFAYFVHGYQYFNLERYHYDEAISIYGAARILNADIAYKDFWTLYAPGQFYLLAGIFKIFGISIKTAKLFAVTILSMTVCSSYYLVRKLCPAIIAVLASLFVSVWLKSYMVFNRPGQLAILCFILSCLPALKFFSTGKNKWLLITGMAISITGLFRQDFGFYVFASMSLITLLKQSNLLKKNGWRQKLKPMLTGQLYLSLGSAIILLPAMSYFIYHSAFKEFIYDTVVFPVTIYPKVRDLPFPALRPETLIFYLPLVIFLLTAIRLFFYNWKDTVKDKKPWMMLFLLFSGIGLFNYTRVRTHIGSLLPTMIAAMILAALLYDDLAGRLRNQRATIIKNCALLGLFISVFILAFQSIKTGSITLNRLFSDKNRSTLDISRANGFYDDSPLARSQFSAIKYIQSNTGKQEKIFVGNSRHDKTVNSDVMFYFLCERGSASKYHELHPGLTDKKEVQKEIITELNKNAVRYIVLWSAREDVNEPNESSISSQIMDLDNFIKENYKTEKEFGSYNIMRHI